MSPVSKFFATLFDDGESTCFSVDKYGTKVFKVTEPPEGSIFFVINPLDGKRDRDPNETYHREDRPRRADANVSAYRNILIEADRTSLEDQLRLIGETGMPYTTVVFSGGKSVHYIISLETPVATRADYDALANRVYKALGGAAVVDTNVKNPSRFSRFPNAIRPSTDGTDNGVPQELQEVKERVPNSTLEDWLIKRGCPREEPKPKAESSTSVSVPFVCGRGQLSGFTLNFLMSGEEDGFWNPTLFKSACDVFKNGYTFDEAIEMFEGITTYLDKSDLHTIRSAFKRINRDTEEV